MTTGPFMVTDRERALLQRMLRREAGEHPPQGGVSETFDEYRPPMEVMLRETITSTVQTAEALELLPARSSSVWEIVVRGTVSSTDELVVDVQLNSTTLGQATIEVGYSVQQVWEAIGSVVGNENVVVTGTTGRWYVEWVGIYLATGNPPTLANSEASPAVEWHTQATRWKGYRVRSVFSAIPLRETEDAIPIGNQGVCLWYPHHGFGLTQVECREFELV